VSLISVLGNGKGLFKSAAVVSSLVMCLFVVSSVSDKDIDLSFNEEFNIKEDLRHNENIEKSFKEALEKSIENEVNKRYKGASASAGVVVKIREDYTADAVYVTLKIKKGDELSVKKFVSEKFNIDEKIIHVKTE
jgi:hypothetical protein